MGFWVISARWNSVSLPSPRLPCILPSLSWAVGIQARWGVSGPTRQWVFARSVPAASYRTAPDVDRAPPHPHHVCWAWRQNKNPRGLSDAGVPCLSSIRWALMSCIVQGVPVFTWPRHFQCPRLGTRHLPTLSAEVSTLKACFMPGEPLPHRAEGEEKYGIVGPDTVLGATFMALSGSAWRQGRPGRADYNREPPYPLKVSVGFWTLACALD